MARLLLLVTFLVSPILFAAPPGSAFSALRIVESQPFGRTSKVLEIRGERGGPFPNEWVILLGDTSARAGVREVTVADGKIISERSPLHGFLGTNKYKPMDSSTLSFDADAAFRLLNREAERKEVGFHWVDYTLSMDAESEIPTWNLKIYDHMGAAIGSILISAKDGTIIRSFQSDPSARTRAETPPSNNRMGGLVGAVGETANHVTQKTKKSTLRFIGTVQEVLVGERTIGPQEEEE